VLVSGEKDAILVDAQFGKGQAEQVVEKIRASGKHLTTIYISHGDPDYYFGLDTLTQRFPTRPRCLRPRSRWSTISTTKDEKLAFWGPTNGRRQTRKPSCLRSSRATPWTLEGHELDIVGLTGRQPERTFVWIPSIKAVVGGVVVADNLHVWMADTQTPQSHRQWLSTLKRIASLQPDIVVPGHYLGDTTIH
jgi:glyoxylase-like metal-dependent hydrolase (beta-lactamase superfamily II)